MSICSSSVFFCQLETAVRVRMNRVNSALSAVLFAFPQSPSCKERMFDDTGKRLVLALQLESQSKSALLGRCSFQIFI